MNGYRFHCRLATAIVIALGLLLLVGCGGLGGSATSAPAAAVSLAKGSLSFGAVAIGSSATMADSISNNTSASVTVNSITGVSSGFQVTGVTLPLVLAAGQAASFNVKFQAAAAGDPSVTISFEDQNAQTLASLSASAEAAAAATLSLNPSAIAFGSVAVGSSQNNTVILSNSGGSDLSMNQATLSGASFAMNNLALPITLHSGDTTSATLTFAPTGTGAFSASVTFTTTSGGANGTTVLDLSGTGIAGSGGTLSASPVSLSFGQVVVGSSMSLNGSLTASGAAITVTSASFNNSEFALSGISLPANLPAGQSASFTVTFTPQSSGSTSASLSFSSTASNSPASQSMTATGTAPVQHTVDLDWSASADAVGYNIYRGTVSGGPYTMINSSLDSTTAYTDSTVVSGQTYYYVVTAVDGNSSESGYSNPAQAVIPSP